MDGKDVTRNLVCPTRPLDRGRGQYPCHSSTKACLLYRKWYPLRKWRSLLQRRPTSSDDPTAVIPRAPRTHHPKPTKNLSSCETDRSRNGEYGEYRSRYSKQVGRLSCCVGGIFLSYCCIVSHLSAQLMIDGRRPGRNRDSGGGMLGGGQSFLQYRTVRLSSTDDRCPFCSRLNVDGS